MGRVVLFSIMITRTPATVVRLPGKYQIDNDAYQDYPKYTSQMEHHDPPP